MSKGRKIRLRGERGVSPLRDNAIVREYLIRSDRLSCEICITIHVLPHGWVLYDHRWVRLPQPGRVVMMSGAVVLYRQSVDVPGQFIEAGRLSTVRARSDGAFFAGPLNGQLPGQHLRAWDADGVVDFDFAGEIDVEMAI